MGDDAELFPLGSPASGISTTPSGSWRPDRTEGGYDVVHAHDFRVLNAGVELSQKYNCPIVATKHTVPAEYRIAIEGR